MCFKVATLKNYSKLPVAYYVGLIILWVRNLGKAQLSSLSLILEASDGEAGTGRSISRMASSLACLVAPCILSLSLSPWVSYSPGPPECLMAWQPWDRHASCVVSQHSKCEHFKSPRGSSPLSCKSHAMSLASHLGQPRVKETEWTPTAPWEECQRICAIFIPSPHSCVQKKEKVLRHEVSTS